MAFERIPTTAAGSKFFDNSNLLKRISNFEREVKADPRTFEQGILVRFEREVVAYGQQELTSMSRVLLTRDFPGGSIPREIAPLLESNLDRYKNLWQRNVQNAFATAASSVPGNTKPGPRSLLERLMDFLLARDREDLRGGYFEENGRVFSVTKLVNATADTVSAPVAVGELEAQLHDKVWTIEIPGKPMKRVSPWEVFKMIRAGEYPKEDTQNHEQRLEFADLRFPIIMQTWAGGISVADGYHRLLKAFLLRKQTMRVRVLHGGLPESAVVLPFSVPSKESLQPQLQGIVRTARVQGRSRIFKQSLSKFLKMLFRTYPMNFVRDHNLLVARSARPEGEGEEIFLINSGKSSNSSPVCAMCQGRALTRSALVMVTRDLQSPLFHPNCRHRILTTSGGRESNYDGKHGPLVTIKTVAGWLSSGKVKRSKRPSPRVVNI